MFATEAYIVPVSTHRSPGVMEMGINRFEQMILNFVVVRHSLDGRGIDIPSVVE